MMKFSVCVVLFLCVPSIWCLSDEMQELIDMLHKTCQGQTGVDEGFIAAAKKGDFSTDDQKIRCYMKCVMAEMSTIDDDGVVDIDAAVGILPDDIRPKMEPVMRKCGGIAGADACDVAFKTFKCFYDGAPADFFLP